MVFLKIKPSPSFFLANGDYMNFEMIKSNNYEVTDDFVAKVEAEFLEEGIFAIEWELFSLRFSLLFDDYEDCTDEFWTDVQERLEQYQSIQSVLSMKGKDAYHFLDGVFRDGYREFKVLSREDEDVCFYGSANVYNREDEEDFFCFTDENGYPSGRRFPLNRYRGNQNELFMHIIVEFCGYTGEIINFIVKSDNLWNSEVFGDIRIIIYSNF